MKIELNGINKNGAEFRVDKGNGVSEYYHGFKSLMDFISTTQERVELLDSKGYQEYSELIKIVEEKNKNI